MDYELGLLALIVLHDTLGVELLVVRLHLVLGFAETRKLVDWWQLVTVGRKGPGLALSMLVPFHFYDHLSTLLRQLAEGLVIGLDLFLGHRLHLCI